MNLPFLRFSTILLCGFIYLFYIPPNSNAAVTSGELQALTDIYNTMNGPYWRNKANWLVGDPCNAGWTGVACSGGSVTGFQMDSNNMTGSIPNSMVGLKFLNYFSAIGNGITGNMTFIFSALPALLRYL